MTPQRIQLSRRAGFRLQESSRALNGLEAVRVARPTKWGNPFKVDGLQAVLVCGERGDKAGKQAAAVKLFRMLMNGEFRRARKDKRNAFQKAFLTIAMTHKAPSLDEVRAELRGKNLACWCKPGTPCHADVLLEIANDPAHEPDMRTMTLIEGLNMMDGSR